VGRTVYEACLRTKKLALKLNLPEKYNLQKENYVLLTMHRAENTNDLERLKV